MAGSEAGSCQVALLVPDRSRIAVLVADPTPPAPPRLPTVMMDSAGPDLPEILAAVEVVDTATTTPVRLVVTRSADAEDADDGAAALVVEFDADRHRGAGRLDLAGPGRRGDRSPGA